MAVSASCGNYFAGLGEKIMKIAEYINGNVIYRDATPAELEAQHEAERQAFYEEVNQPLTLERKLELFVESIPVLPRPKPADRPGYLWRPMYDAQGRCFGWEEVADPYYVPAQTGGYTDPIPYTEGMAVTEGLWYTGGGEVWECIRSGSGSAWDRQWFDMIPA